MRTKSLFPYAGQWCPVEIYGYSTYGVPGIEIIGMGKYARVMKEKFVYLSRNMGVAFPKMRYVLCVEGDVEEKKFRSDEYRYLELPLVIMLWTLTGNLPLAQLDDCFISGKISTGGVVSSLDLKDRDFELLMPLFSNSKNIKVIANNSVAIHDDFYHLSVEELLLSLKKNVV